MLPDLSGRCLVFHRGITVAEASGMYTSQKIDLLVEYLVVAPAKAVGGWVGGGVGWAGWVGVWVGAEGRGGRQGGNGGGEDLWQRRWARAR